MHEQPTWTQPFSRPAQTPWNHAVGLEAVLEGWRADRRVANNLVLDTLLPGRAGTFAELPAETPAAVRRALAARGITELYQHQAEALRLVRAGRDLVVATPTASGKSLCFNLPVLERLSRDGNVRALYLFPTKALSRDQEQALLQLLSDAGVDRGAVTYDGDTPGDARRAARDGSAVILTNPDMLHAGILPHHPSWARFFSNLEVVVVDELHAYRGVMGSHLSNVLRRLDRVARFHGARPTYIMASATIGNPREHAERLVGRPVDLVCESGAPAGPRRLMIYNPPVVNEVLQIRQSYLKAAVRLAADLVAAEVPTLVFAQSRNVVEVMLKYLRERLAEHQVPAETVQGYRGGYLPGTRRRIEKGLRGGEVRCVVATHALELGIDIGALSAVVCAGYPGSIAGTWQRFGRAGRRGETSLALLVTSSAPHDQYLAVHPTRLTDTAIEQARIDPDNVEILLQHLKCAAFELPFAAGDPLREVPAEAVGQALGFLTEHRVVHPAPNRDGRTLYHWSADAYPANDVSLRAVGWDNVVIIDVAVDRTIGELDWRSSHTMLHEQAIYQQDGEQYQVEKLDLEQRKAYVRKVEPDYFTTAMTHTKLTVIHEDHQVELRGPRFAATVGQGDVSVVERVVGFKKIKFHSHENVGYGEIRLPELQMHTTAFWLTVPEGLVEAMNAPRPEVVDALRGLGHALHLVASMSLMTDSRDLGFVVGDGADGELPPGKGEGAGGVFAPTLFLFDHVAGGVGLAARLFDEHRQLCARTRTALAACGCVLGCPACIGPAQSTIQTAATSPRKQLALRVLDLLGIAAE